SFAMNDPSAEVRKQAIQALCWIGATDSLTRVVDALDNHGLQAALPAFFPETIPHGLRPRFATANRRLLTHDTTPLARIRRLLQRVEFGDPPPALDLKTELNALTPPLDEYAGHAVGEALKIVKIGDPTWVSTWVTAKLLDGTVWGDHYRPYVLAISQQQADDL